MSKRRGPRAEPWGTPEVMMGDLELWELSTYNSIT